MNETPQSLWVPDGLIASRDVFNNIQIIKEEAINLLIQFDQDNDGLLNDNEFEMALRSLGIRKQQAKVIRQLWDIENTKLINVEIFTQIYCFIRSGRLYTRSIDKFEALENSETLLNI